MAKMKEGYICEIIGLGKQIEVLEIAEGYALVKPLKGTIKQGHDKFRGDFQFEASAKPYIISPNTDVKIIKKAS